MSCTTKEEGHICHAPPRRRDTYVMHHRGGGGGGTQISCTTEEKEEEGHKCHAPPRRRRGRRKATNVMHHQGGGGRHKCHAPPRRRRRRRKATNVMEHQGGGGGRPQMSWSTKLFSLHLPLKEIIPVWGTQINSYSNILRLSQFGRHRSTLTVTF